MNDQTTSNAPGRVYLQSIAEPSILGLYAFRCSFIVGAYLARWYSGSKTSSYLFPFTASLGSAAQFAAAIWSYKARNRAATVMHGV
jgi:uncharacterized protein